MTHNRSSRREGDVEAEFLAWLRAYYRIPETAHVDPVPFENHHAAYLAGRNAGIEASAKKCSELSVEPARANNAIVYTAFTYAEQAIRALKEPGNG